MQKTAYDSRIGLVGWEMYIRDNHKHLSVSLGADRKMLVERPPEVFRMAEAAQPGHRGDRCLGVLQQGARGPVSYTPLTLPTPPHARLCRSLAPLQKSPYCIIFVQCASLPLLHIQ